jgi:hypothetical protein
MLAHPLAPLGIREKVDNVKELPPLASMFAPSPSKMRLGKEGYAYPYGAFLDAGNKLRLLGDGLNAKLDVRALAQWQGAVNKDGAIEWSHLSQALRDITAWCKPPALPEDS